MNTGSRKQLIGCGHQRARCWLAPLLLLLPWMVQPAMGTPVGAEQAAAAVRGWLKLGGSPLGAPLNRPVSQVDTFRNNADYFAVSLVPEGCVILVADDAAEPIVAFSPRGNYDRLRSYERQLPRSVSKQPKQKNA